MSDDLDGEIKEEINEEQGQETGSTKKDIEDTNILNDNIQREIPKNNEFEDNEMFKIIEEKQKAKPLGFFSRFICLFFSPVKLVQNIKINPSIIAPTIVLTILSLISGFIYSDYVILSLQGLSEMAIKNGAPADFYIDKMATLEGTTFSVFGSIGMLIGLLIGTVIMSVILLIVCKIFKGKGRFIQYFSLWLHVNIIAAIFMLISQSLSVALGTLTNFTSLAALMPNGDMGNILYSFLMCITISGIWSAIITCFGIKEFNDFSSKKSIIIMVSLFAIQVIFFTFYLTMSYNFQQMSFSAMQ